MPLPRIRLALHWQILIAILLAAAAGWAAGEQGALFGLRWIAVFDFFGALFLSALKMIILPLIAASIIASIAGMGEGLGRLGARTLGFYLISSSLAVLVGLAWVNLVAPGISGGNPVGPALALEAKRATVSADLQGGGSLGQLADIFQRMIPTNVVQAASDNGSILAVIFFSVLFGYALSRRHDAAGDTLRRFWEGIYEVMIVITDWIMRLAPIGVFALVAAVVARTGFGAVQPLLVFAVTVLAALATHLFVVLPLMARVFGGARRPWRLFKPMAPALLTAFSTASSAATLPVTLEGVERAGVSRRTASFVLPLGATVNMNGTALYECVAVIFLAQAYGVHLGFVTQLLIVVTAVVTSIGVAGIPSASLVAIVVIMNAVGLPAEAIAVLFVFDRLLDMSRTAVNIYGDATCAVIVAHRSGETGLLASGAATPAVDNEESRD
ncbi:MAG TPA: dicarboxylate/amino acid:cation symporter [Rhodanobacteraceae bacterium]|nr:dicarboxylate/amino acid:cation symporter [Rhodanobacteraceae bacterium]